MKRFLYLIALLVLPLFAETQPIGPFQGLNNTNDPVSIRLNQAQDLLNVDITKDGKSVKKRKGYGQAFQLAVTTSTPHGAFSYFNDDGSDVMLFFHDGYGQASVSGGSLTTLFSSRTVDSTYQCVDSQGFAYCATTAREPIFYTDGVTYTHIPEASTGTIIAVSRDRLGIAGMSFAPNRVDFSASGDLTDFTLAGLGSSPLQITISAPGSKMTHLTYAFGRWVWFKDRSFGTINEGPNLIDWTVEVISPNIGTNDNSSYYDNGVLQFRGNDGHIYGWDGAYGISKLTQELEGSIGASQFRVSNSWTQTSQSDFENGVSTPTGWSDTSTTAGEITNRTTTYLYTSTTDWSGGSVTAGYAIYADTITSTGSIASTFPDPFTYLRNGGTNEKDVWSETTSSGGGITETGSVIRLTDDNSGSGGTSTIQTLDVIGNASSGVTFYYTISGYDACGSENFAAGFDIINSSLTCSYYHTFTPTQINSLSNSGANDSNCPNLATTVSDIGEPLSVKLYIDSSIFALDIDGTTTDGSKTGTNSLVLDTVKFGLSLNPVTFSACTSGSDSFYADFDKFNVSPQTFTFTTSSIDTGITGGGPYWDVFEITHSSDSDSAITYESEVSSDDSSWDAGVTATPNSNLGSSNKEYVRFNLLFNNSVATGSASSVSDITVNAYSSGTYLSAVNNASSITSWDTFSASIENNGGGHTFYMRSATYSFVSTDTTPSWTQITNNAVPSISTGTYFQIKDDFSATESTHTPSMQDFTINWFEGQASDKAYVEKLDDSIWWAVPVGESQTTNNKILRFDLINGVWTIYDIATNGMLVRNNDLYFVSSSTGVVYKFGDTDDDAGEDIEAYWKSKDFFFGSPFLDKEITAISSMFDSIENSSVTVTYTVDASSTITYTVYQYDSGNGVKINNKRLPVGKVGKTFNIKFGNDASDQPFELFAVGIDYRMKSWKPED